MIPENINQAQNKDYCCQMAEVRHLIDKHGLPMKAIRIIKEGGVLTIYFCSENRVDFRNLVRDLNALFGEPVRLHQIGPREEAKIIGGFGVCGKTLCCASFLKNYEPIPNEELKKSGEASVQSNGACGKLMCCLAYDGDFCAGSLKKRHTESLIDNTAVICENPESDKMTEAQPDENSMPMGDKPEVIEKDKETQIKAIAPAITKHLIRKLTLRKPKK